MNVLYLFSGYRLPCERAWLSIRPASAYPNLITIGGYHPARTIKTTKGVLDTINRTRDAFALHTYDLFVMYAINNELQRFQATNGESGFDPSQVIAYHCQDNVTEDIMDATDTKLIDCDCYERYSDALLGDFEALLYGERMPPLVCDDDY